MNSDAVATMLCDGATNADYLNAQIEKLTFERNALAYALLHASKFCERYNIIAWEMGILEALNIAVEIERTLPPDVKKQWKATIGRQKVGRDGL